MKRTKIVGTIGPASEHRTTLERMIEAGMNVARLNMSHGTPSWHRAAIKNVLAAGRSVGEPVAILVDLSGPKIRLGSSLPENGVAFKGGDLLAFGQGKKAIPVTYANLAQDLKAGARMLIDDGRYEFIVQKLSGRTIFASAITDGTLLPLKGMNFPDSTLKVGAMTDKDKKDLALALKAEAHFIALSFVTSAKQVQNVRRFIRRVPNSKSQPLTPKLIAKIEKHEAIKNFSAILKKIDGIMIARGDLGAEIPIEEVPIRQKEMIVACRAAGKPVIVATQMLDSMVKNPRPTRAEVSDVANAVIDHADAVMLSNETAVGAWPVETVAVMRRIAEKTEASRFDDIGKRPLPFQAVITRTSIVPRVIRSRPEVPIFVACDSEFETRQVNLRWGTIPFLFKGQDLRQAAALLRRVGLIKPRDRVRLLSR